MLNNFRATHVGAAYFRLNWDKPNTSDYNQDFWKWQILDADDGDAVIHTSYSLTAAAREITTSAEVSDHSLAPFAENTRYRFKLKVYFRRAWYDDWDEWVETSDTLEVWTINTHPSPVLSNTYSHDEWAAGRTFLSFTRPDGTEFTCTYTVQQQLGDSDADWLDIYSTTNGYYDVSYAQLQLEDLNPRLVHNWRVKLEYYDGTVVYSNTISIDQFFDHTEPIDHYPYVLAVPKSLNTPVNIFVGNIPNNLAWWYLWDDYDTDLHPSGIREWYRSGEALYNSTEVWIYRRKYPGANNVYGGYYRAANWRINDHLYILDGKLTAANVERWWDMASAGTVKIYAPITNFSFDGTNNPFQQVEGIIPIPGQWDFPSTLVTFDGAGENHTPDSTPNMAVFAEYSADGEGTVPFFFATEIDDDAYEIVGSAVEDYVIPVFTLTGTTVTYKLYVFIPHEYVMNDGFELTSSDGTDYTLTEVSADTSYLGKDGKLFSATMTATPKVDGEYQLKMDITEDTYQLTDGNGHTFAVFTWPGEAIDVSYNNDGSPFYVANDTVNVTVPSSPYDNLAAQLMIVNVIPTNPYAAPSVT